MKYSMEPDYKTKYQLLLKNTAELILFFDMSGRITECNSTAQNELGCGEDIFHMTINSIFHDVFVFYDDHIIIDNRFADKMHETTAYRKNQTCFPVNLKVIEEYRNDSYIGICIAENIVDSKQASREISELKRELSNSNQINGDLVAKVAHELRTPLNGILGFVSNLMDMQLSPDQLEAVNIINLCANNLNSLLNDLMDYTLLTSQTFALNVKEFSFSEFIRNIEELNIGSINEKGLKYLHYFASDIPDRLLGDELRLTQILNNLFSNAVKFTPSGHISLEVIKLLQTEQDVELFFMINDTGIGIEREKMGLLFQSFSQLDGSIRRRYGGAGLGLMICKKYVEAMQGSINVDSVINKGSTFSFTVRFALPMVTDRSESEKKGILIQDQTVTEEGLYSGNGISIYDYINKELLSIKVNLKSTPNIYEQDGAIDTNDLLQGIIICIEMENWEKAEQLACRMKSLLPKYEKLSSNGILRLLLCIRRENRVGSLSILQEIKSMIS